MATDTLAVELDGSPAFFTSKAFMLPHLNMIVAGTGLSGLTTRWFSHINDNMLVRGIDNLDVHTPGCLKDKYDEICGGLNDVGHVSSTIYHIGFSERESMIRSFAYRSENRFQSEALPYGLAVKPECSVPEPFKLPHDLGAMMQDQRERQRRSPKEDRIYIGGEIFAIHPTAEGATTSKVAQFDDYSATVDEMWDNFPSG